MQRYKKSSCPAKKNALRYDYIFAMRTYGEDSGQQDAAQQPDIGALDDQTGHFVDQVEGGVGLYIQHDV